MKNNNEIKELNKLQFDDICLYNADALDVLRGLESSSIDALITDPPAGIDFMGLDWDKNKGGRDNWVRWITEIFTEAYRVLKPGAHCIVWSIPRTTHWAMWAVENSGFDIRDVIIHVFRSGIPKGRNIARAIDEASNKIGTYEYKGDLVKSKKYAHIMQKTHILKDRREPNPMIYKANTELAKSWQGWNTSLKPAYENWILARKPIKEKTVDKNCVQYGVGAINIDKCRVPIVAKNETDKRATGEGKNYSKCNVKSNYFSFDIGDIKHHFTPELGRYPSNLLCSDKALDTGAVIKGGISNKKSSGTNKVYGEIKKVNNNKDIETNDTGGESRYFDLDLWFAKNGILQYPKPQKSEKENGLYELESKWVGYGNQFKAVLKRDEDPSEIKNKSAKTINKTKNLHPTVKSIKLMQYLIKLVTREGQVVLDCFMGSGTTGVASKLTNRKFVGIELEDYYFKTAYLRIKNETVQESLFGY